MRQLCDLIQSSEAKDLWKQVRHFLGRLCSWVRASRYLVVTCRHFRHRIKNARVQQAEISLRTITFQLPWGDPSDILREVLPDFHESRLQDALQARQNDKLIDPIILCLSRMVEGRFKPYIHAEIILLVHFYVHRLEFVAGDRYIAGSKPSCYCCDLYARHHPAGILLRRSHGNIWLKWTAPELCAEMVLQGTDVLRSMLNYVRLDLRSQLLSGLVHASRPPDSTTGLGSSEPRYDLA